jgi:uncharacterized protein YyaL (SSP411 family)
VAIVGDGDDADLLQRIGLMATSPGTVVARDLDGTESTALLRDRPTLNGLATAYVCEQMTCQAPTTDPAALAVRIGARWESFAG